jgi:hypothetical protein
MILIVLVVIQLIRAKNFANYTYFNGLMKGEVPQGMASSIHKASSSSGSILADYGFVC